MFRGDDDHRNPERAGACRLDDVLARISADCAWRDDPRGSGCGAYFSDLPPRRPPDMPARAMRVIAGGKQ